MADHGQPGNAGLEQHGFRNIKRVNWNWTAAELYERAVQLGEGKVAKDGPLVVLTGQHTGRSPKDKYFVTEPSSESHIWWENNQAMTPERFDTLFAAMTAYAQNRELYVQDLYGGADPTHRLPVRVITEFAWHSLFIQHLLIEPRAGELQTFKPEFTIVCLPGFAAVPSFVF
jgi:phosphoenolpyruvate carboxykinase (ATP)